MKMFCIGLLLCVSCAVPSAECVDECPEGSNITGRCATNDPGCTEYATCTGGGISCSSTCNPAPVCPSGTEAVGNTGAIYPALPSRVIDGCGFVLYCAPCAIAPLCPDGEVPSYDIVPESGRLYDCDMLAVFECISIEECLTCDEPAFEVESCESEENCSETMCGDTSIACEYPPNCARVDVCDGATSPVLRSGDGVCPEDATHCVEPRCRGEGVFCETTCHPEGRSVESVDLCADENCNFVDVGDERVWCAGEPYSCEAIPACDEGDTAIERDMVCAENADCYYRAACGQVIQCESIS